MTQGESEAGRKSLGDIRYAQIENQDLRVSKRYYYPRHILENHSLGGGGGLETDGFQFR